MFHGVSGAFSRVVIIAMLGAGIWVGFTQRAVAAQDEDLLWACKAEGVYTTCAATRSLRPCQDFRAEGIGVAEDKVMASIEAEGTCSDQMLRMISLKTVNGRASIKVPCVRVVCELKQ